MKQARNNKEQSIAIVGMGSLFPKASNLKEYWRLLSRGEDAIIEVPSTHWSTVDYYRQDSSGGDYTYCKRGGFLSPTSFDPTEFNIPPNILEATDTSQLLGLVVTRMALEDAGYGENGKAWNRDAAGVIVGVTGTQELVIPLSSRLGFPIWRKALENAGVTKEQLELVMEQISDAYVGWQESSFPGLLGNVVAGRIANRFDLGGTNCVVDAACASSLAALNLAVLELISGRSDMMIAGGIDTLNDIFMHMCFVKTSVLSFSGDAKPFSREADGTVLGEGLGLFVLKRLEDAEKDQDKIYAVIKAIGTSSDGRSAGIYAPVASGQTKAIRRAYQYAGISPDSVEMVEAHGTGTRVGDAVEFEALSGFFKEEGVPQGQCALGSVKSMIGHAKAAAGAASLVKTSLALYHKAIPPTLKVDEPDPKLGIDQSPFYISTTLRPWFPSAGHPRRAALSSFGFGGSNYHMILEEYAAEKTIPAWDGTVEIVAVSGASKADITGKLNDFTKSVNEAGSGVGGILPVFGRLAADTRRRFQHDEKHRALVIVNPVKDDVPETLKNAVDAINNTDQPIVSGENVFYGVSGHPEGPIGKTAFLFPGQGSQYPYMAGDLAVIFPEAHRIFETANKQFDHFHDASAQRLSDYIFPAGYTRDQKKRVEAQLRNTDIAQPAIGTVSLAMVNVLSRFGLTADMAGGHSFGELTALCSAGWMDEETYLSLAAARGKYMAAAGREPGAMLAVKEDLARIEALIQENNLDLVLANRNSYDQGVLSGREDEIERALGVCKQHRIRATRLPVSAAFHTTLVQDAAKPFKDYLRKKDLSATSVPVYSNTTAGAYPDDSTGIKKLLGGQILNPVNFVQEVEQMYADGARIFLEIGPKSVLTGLVRSVLNGRDFHALSLDASTGRKNGLIDLAKTLCFFAAAGHVVNLENWEDIPPGMIRDQKMSVPICGANYRKERPGKPRRITPPVEKKPAVATVQPEPAEPEPTVSSPTVDGGVVRDALKVVSDSLKSMQALQQQTALAHQKFLETQSEAGRALGVVMEKTRHLSTTIVSSGDAPPVPAGLPISSSPVPSGTTPEAPRPVAAPESAAPPVDSVPSPAPIPPSSSGLSGAVVEKAMLDIVSRVTGYPGDMLNLEMDIENDLGIDSIKRVEILSVFEEDHPDIPSAAPEDLAEMRTLKEICDHLLSLAGSGTIAAATATPPPTAPSPAPGITAEAVQSAMLDIVSRVTGYPGDMLNLEMDIENDLGIDSIKRVEILSVFEEEHPDIPSAAPEDLAEMRTLKEICDHLLSLAGSGTIASGTIAAATATPPPTAPSPAPGITAGAVQSAMLDIVSRVTGYPGDMLNLEMDIENDLGIDSIKRVEILSVFEEEHPDIPSAAPEDLAEMRTLGEICDHLLSLAGPTASISSPDHSAQMTRDVLRRKIILREQPLADVNPITLSENRVVYVTGNDPEMGNAICDHLMASGIKTGYLETLDGNIDFSKAGGLVIVSGVMPGKEMLWTAEDEEYVKAVFEVTAGAGQQLVKNSGAGDKTLFAAVTRLDGDMGFGEKADFNPVPAAMSGLVKTAAIEWDTVNCRVIDVDPEWRDVEAAAKAVVSEILNPAGPLEVGLSDKTRRVVDLVETPYPEGDIELTHEDVIVVSGGARGVTAECVKTLSEKTPAAVALLGRSPAPGEEPEWLKPVTGEAEIKKKIMTNEFAGQKVSPMELEAAYKKHMANREILETLKHITRLGRNVAYYPVDIRDREAVKAVFGKINQNQGVIRCLIHGAGVLEDRFILEKTRLQFDRVFDTKVLGIRTLLSVVDKNSLRYVVLFSSVSARMGNKGQADYAMANEVLNKTAHKLALRFPECKAVAVNWGPWDGGMVTAALKREFEKNGVALIPLADGARCMLAEMAGSGRSGHEIVIGAGFSDLTIAVETVVDSGQPGQQPLTISKNKDLTLAFEREISLAAIPVLKDHLLNGKAVVPFALAAEWVGSGALHANPGLLLTGIDDMRVLSGITLNGEVENMEVMAGKARKNGSVFEVEVQINTSDGDADKRLRYTAKAVLSADYDIPPSFSVPASLSGADYGRSISEVYAQVLFHGPELAGIRKIYTCNKTGLKADVACAPKPRQWIAQPLRNTWLADPLVLDTAFQLAIVWCYENAGAVSLPVSFTQYRQYQQAFPAEGVTAILEVKHQTPHKMRGDFTFLDAGQKIVARMTDYEAVIDQSLQKAFRIKKS